MKSSPRGKYFQLLPNITLLKQKSCVLTTDALTRVSKHTKSYLRSHIDLFGQFRMFANSVLQVVQQATVAHVLCDNVNWLLGHLRAFKCVRYCFCVNHGYG